MLLKRVQERENKHHHHSHQYLKRETHLHIIHKRILISLSFYVFHGFYCGRDFFRKKIY